VSRTPQFREFAQPAEVEVDEDLVERHPVQRIELGPGQLAAAHAIHARPVAGAPCVGELRRVDRHAFRFRQRRDLARDRGSPVHDRAEGVEDEGLDAGDRCRRAAATAFCARHHHCSGLQKLTARHAHGAPRYWEEDRLWVVRWPSKAVAYWFE